MVKLWLAACGMNKSAADDVLCAEFTHPQRHLAAIAESTEFGINIWHNQRHVRTGAAQQPGFGQSGRAAANHQAGPPLDVKECRIMPHFPPVSALFR